MTSYKQSLSVRGQAGLPYLLVLLWERHSPKLSLTAREFATNIPAKFLGKMNLY